MLVTPTPTPGRYAIVPMRTGRVGIITAPGDTMHWEVASSIEEPAPERLRPLKSAQPIRPRWWPTVVLVLAVLAVPLFWLWRRLRRRQRPSAAFAIAAEPPHEVALLRLQQLVDGDLLRREQFDRYYVEASHALRSYICGRYRVPVLDWTSAEVVDRLRAAGYERELVATVGPLLLEADAVKFAADRPTEHAAVEWVERARRWILETAVEPVYSTARGDRGGRGSDHRGAIMSFAHPWVLALVPLALLLVWLSSAVWGRGAAMLFSGNRLLDGVPRGWRARTHAIPAGLRAVGVALLVVTLAGPQKANTEEQVEGEGIDIAVVLDISGSMRALDFEPEDRLAVAKSTIRNFVDGRTHDRISLVVFAAKAFTQCPLTLDYDVLKRFLDEVRVGIIEDGTAIGLGIATGVKRLSRSEATSKVLVLLTDGVNNVPTVDPRTAAEAAKALDVKIYSVGVGKEGVADYPVDHPVYGRRTTQIETHIDEELLQEISRQTGGQYFRAESAESLQRIFDVIDELETTRLETTIYTNYSPLLAWFLLPAILLLVIELLLSATVYRVLP